ncbi:MAG: glycosyltransferase [Sphingobacteriales bacterium]|nr:MAG: glycosyltransferase [Sphingobacteriales bacterium]TAF83183.1 MAG: glycosyltransferase [Sphingobacteriales bacterium]
MQLISNAVYKGYYLFKVYTSIIFLFIFEKNCILINRLLHTIVYFTLFGIFILCFCLQAYYLLGLQAKFCLHKIGESSQTNIQSVSVIICARNEAKNLEKNLSYILAQQYPSFEVIVVNDCSYDTTEDVLKTFVEQYPNLLKVVHISEHPRHKTSKKFAATLGIKASAHEILVFTDADCRPQSPQWLGKMVAHYHNPNIEIVLGFSPYEAKNGFLNKLIRYETCITAINYLACAIIGKAYMGIGRNLSYKKSVFFKGKGFASHMHIPSGDDDLFVNQHAKRHNVAIEYSADAQVLSQPKTSFTSLWKQKIRHLGAGQNYKRVDKQRLTLQFLSGCLFYVLAVLLLVLKFMFLWVIAILMLRYFLQLIIYQKGLVKLQSKNLLGWIIFTDPLYYATIFLWSVASLFTKKTTWK